MNIHQSQTTVISVNEAARISSRTPHNVRQWIRDNKIIAKKQNSVYEIDRTSLETYLQRINPKAQPVRLGSDDSTQDQSPAVDLHGPALMGPGTGQTQNSELASTPSVENAKIEETIQQKTVTKDLDQRSDVASKSAETTEVSKPSEANKAGKVKKDGKKRVAKGPVRHAKDTMRHMDAAQLREVRDWVLMRMDRRAKLI